MLVIISIMLIKFKPTYIVEIGSTAIGYVEDKEKFKETLKETLYDNVEENIAFSDIKEDITYKLKLVNKNQNISEEQVMLKIKEKADITYCEYAVNVNGVKKIYTKSEKEAKDIIDNLRNEFPDENIAMTIVYTKKLNITNQEELASAISKITEEVSGEGKENTNKKASSINGVRLATAPVAGTITSRYGAREFDVRDHVHQGLDIAAKNGTPIKAVAKGTVKFSGVKGGYGNIIILDHGNGIETYYGHCSKLTVKAGEKVKSGDVIAEVGSTGNSTGPHLHFEIRENGKYINPQKYLYK